MIPGPTKSVGQKSPEYLKLYEALKDQIIRGAYASGQRLPSKRALAEERGVSVITAQHALDLLSQEGYVTTRERSGTYVSFSQESGAYTGSGEKGASLRDGTAAVPENHFPMSVLARHMRRVLSDENIRILERAPSGGSMALRAALSAYLKRAKQIDVPAERIVIGAGAEYLYGLIVTMLGRHRVYAFEHPSYEKIARVYQANDVVVEPLPLGQRGIDTAALQRSEATVLHVTPYRSFPTGITADASKRHEYLRWADRPDRYMIEDDYSSEFSLSGKPEDTLFAMSTRQNVIYINTFSKTIAPSVRIGYMLLPESLMPLYTERVGFYACAVPVFEQLVLSSLLNSGDFERHIRRIRRMLNRSAAPS